MITTTFAAWLLCLPLLLISWPREGLFDGSMNCVSEWKLVSFLAFRELLVVVVFSTSERVRSVRVVSHVRHRSTLWLERNSRNASRDCFCREGIFEIQLEAKRLRNTRVKWDERLVMWKWWGCICNIFVFWRAAGPGRSEVELVNVTIKQRWMLIGCYKSSNDMYRIVFKIIPIWYKRDKVHL